MIGAAIGALAFVGLLLYYGANATSEDRSAGHPIPTGIGE
jgi:hypothetical protein